MTYINKYASREDKLWHLLSGTIVLLLAVYIVTLNFAVSESFRKGEIERDSKVVRQDLQKSQEYLIADLSNFYDQYSNQFNMTQISKQEFVSRQDNFAVSERENIR